MIGKRALFGAMALALAAGALGGTATQASAASVGITVGIPGMYGYPPPRERSCYRWSHRWHQWVWVCHRERPLLRFDMRHHRWHDDD
jgi:hypothetical protein